MASEIGRLREVLGSAQREIKRLRGERAGMDAQLRAEEELLHQEFSARTESVESEVAA